MVNAKSGQTLEDHLLYSLLSEMWKVIESSGFTLDRLGPGLLLNGGGVYGNTGNGSGGGGGGSDGELSIGWGSGGGGC